MAEKNIQLDEVHELKADENAIENSVDLNEGSSQNKFAVPLFNEHLTQAVERIDGLYSADSPEEVVQGVSSGFPSLDQITNGFEPGHLVVIAGRPSMGKSILAMNMAEHIALEKKLPVAIFTMEMSSLQYTNRLLASTSGISLNTLCTGRLADEDWMKLTYGIGKLSDAPLVVDETPALTFKNLSERAKEAARQLGGSLGAIVIDYIQLMYGEWNLPTTNRNNEISDITRGLKALAKEMGLPIFAISQLSRSVEQRTNKRPILADLCDSGALEEDADVIIFLYRDEYYSVDSPDKGIAEAIVAKNRHGKKGSARLVFNEKILKFECLKDKYPSCREKHSLSRKKS